MMILGTLMLVSALLAVLSQNMRLASLWIWLCSVFLGAISMAMGAEFLALIQWVFGSLIGLMLVFYSVLFGEKSKSSTPTIQRLLYPILPGVVVAAGVCFVFVWVLKRELFIFGTSDSAPGLQTVGKKLLDPSNALTLVVIGVLFLVSIVGVGSQSRPESTLPEGE